MKGKRYSIQELSELTGFSRRTIRYYIQEGLLEPPAGRGRGGYYYDSHLNILSKIRQLQNQGLKLGSIAQILKDPLTETLGKHIPDPDIRFKAASADSAVDEIASFARESFAESKEAAASPAPPAREIWVNYSIVDGVALCIRRDIDIKHRKLVDQVLRLAGAILKKSAKGE